MINKHVYNTLFDYEIEIKYNIFLYIDLVLSFLQVEQFMYLGHKHTLLSLRLRAHESNRRTQR